MSPYRIPVARKLRSCIAAANSSLAIITTAPPSTTLYYLRNALTPNTLKSMCRQLDSIIWSFSLQFSKPIDTLCPPRRPSRQPMKSLKPVSKTVLGIKNDVIEESKGFNRHAELGNGVEHRGGRRQHTRRGFSTPQPEQLPSSKSISTTDVGLEHNDRRSQRLQPTF
jgi:hypothetical protein